LSWARLKALVVVAAWQVQNLRDCNHAHSGMAMLWTLLVLCNLDHRGRAARTAWAFEANLAESAGCVRSALPAIHHPAMSCVAMWGEPTGCVRTRIIVGGTLEIIVLASSGSASESHPSASELGDISQSCSIIAHQVWVGKGPWTCSPWVRRPKRLSLPTLAVSDFLLQYSSRAFRDRYERRLGKRYGQVSPSQLPISPIPGIMACRGASAWPG
jgi:hypothetical protein